MAASPTADAVNVNVGVLGHVDSGKTSLVRALSTNFSTASLDKHPQSQQRGITLDLGFSSFTVDAPSQVKEHGFSEVQFTLVDCPGHASLIRTIIGGAQIIDMMILVVDITKGIQAQTAECIVIGEVLTTSLTVVLNKVDLVPDAQRESEVERVSQLVHKALAGTRFKKTRIVAAAASVGGGGVRRDDAGGEAKAGAVDPSSFSSVGVAHVVEALRTEVQFPARATEGSLYYVFDHCFAVKGKGTVLTGTVLSGAVRPGDTVELPALRATHKVKSLQMFRKPVDRAVQGDRVAMLVPGLEAKELERGVVASPGTLRELQAAVVLVRKVKYHKDPVKTGSKFHVTAGHKTTMATATFFGNPILPRQLAQQGASGPPPGADNTYARPTGGAPAAQPRAAPSASGAAGVAGAAGAAGSTLEVHSSLKSEQDQRLPRLPFDPTADYPLLDELVVGVRPDEIKEGSVGGGGGKGALRWALLEFESPVMCPINSMVIGSRLDAEAVSGYCRLAFYGRICHTLRDTSRESLSAVRAFRWKERTGRVDRVLDSRALIGKDMFSKSTDLSSFLNMTVTLPSGQAGRIEGAFGKSGKLRVVFSEAVGARPGQELALWFKRYLFDAEKRMVQG